jgi:hypothetical protein
VESYHPFAKRLVRHNTSKLSRDPPDPPGDDGLATRGDLGDGHMLDPHVLPTALAELLQRQGALLKHDPQAGNAPGIPADFLVQVG